MPEQDQSLKDREFALLYQRHMNARKELPEAREKMLSAHADMRAELDMAGGSEEVLPRQVAALQRFRAFKRRFDELRSTIYSTNREARQLDPEMWGALPAFTEDPDD